jgi:YD repeat-containing protein
MKRLERVPLHIPIFRRITELKIYQRFLPRWKLVVFLLFLPAALAIEIDATPTVQIQTGSADNYSRALVRATNGNLYAAVGDYSTGRVRVYESTDGGSSWTEQDAAHAPPGAEPSAAIDGNGTIHLAYCIAGAGLRYNTFSTTTKTFSGDTSVVPYGYFTPAIPKAAIAVDSNNRPHILYEDEVRVHGSPIDTVTYIDNVGLSTGWNAKVGLASGYVGDILVSQSNIPQLSYESSGGIVAAIGNANRATTFTTKVVAASVAGVQQPSIVMDSSNNTWIAFLSGSSGSQVPAVVEHKAADSWSTWQTPIQDTGATVYNQNVAVSLSVIGTTLYVAYPPSVTNVVWQRYDGTSWSTPVSFGFPSTSPVLEWSEWFDNGGCNRIGALITRVSNILQPSVPYGAYWAEINWPPTISGLSLYSGPVGASVTISGTNLAATPCASTVKFNGVTASPTSITNSQIVVPVPAGATTGAVVVTVGALSSNPVGFTVLGTISGTVTNASNGTGINGASVQALQANTVVGSATTSSNGSYIVSNLPAGSYDLRFSAAGFGSTVSPGNVVVGGSSTTVNAALTAPGTISGRITQSDGVTPISGASVSAGQGSSGVASATTDGSGNYTLSSLGAGGYTVVAAATGYASQVAGGVSVTSGNTTTKNFSLTAGTQSTISYFYDELGRLNGASDSQGNTATYNYDAVGNLLSISVNPSSQVSIVTFDPIAGHVGASVTINGTGFSTTPSQNAVTLNGSAATVTSATSTQMVVTVPTGATTGPIRVTAPGGSATSSSNFTVQ